MRGENQISWLRDLSRLPSNACRRYSKYLSTMPPIQKWSSGDSSAMRWMSPARNDCYVASDFAGDIILCLLARLQRIVLGHQNLVRSGHCPGES